MAYSFGTAVKSKKLIVVDSSASSEYSQDQAIKYNPKANNKKSCGSDDYPRAPARSPSGSANSG